MAWYDLFKLWRNVGEQDPISRNDIGNDIEGAGATVPGPMPDLRNDGSYWGGGRGNLVRLRDSYDLIDLSSTTNRMSRYKEYERLRQTCSEIESVLTIYADESCIHGDTRIATPMGFRSIRELAENKDPNEEFLVYCYDFEKKDYTLGWAYHPRIVKKAKTVRIVLENGDYFICTPDHRVLLSNSQWIEAGKLKKDDELLPFYRVSPKNLVENDQFQRIYTQKDGWKPEKQFIEEWKTGTKTDQSDRLSKIMRCLRSGLNGKQTASILKRQWASITEWLSVHGFPYKEITELNKKYPDTRKVLYVTDSVETDVYDLSVKQHENFCTDMGVFHNCQIGDNGHVFRIDCKNKDIKEELNFLFFHPKMLNMDRRMWNLAKNLFLKGDEFLEIIIDPDNPKSGIMRIQRIEADSMYRIETIKGKLVEFQQSKEGPDYQSLARVEVTQATQQDLMMATAIRFTPKQIVHLRIGDDRQQFYPYGVSLAEAARGPAHQLRLLEDAMLVYRLSRAPERKVFYIDVGGLPSFKAEALMERLKDQLRKIKVSNPRVGSGSGNSVEERWVAPSQDEDFWIPVKQGSNTRIETLPGATSLGEIDDVVYFRRKVYIALGFPQNYGAQEDPSLTKVSVSSNNVSIARQVERLQLSMSDAMMQIAQTHLELRGYPPEMYDDLEIHFTPPSNYRQVSKNELDESLYNRAMSVKQSQLMSDFDVLTKILSIPEDDAKEIASRAMAQKMMELKLQMLASNPEWMGIAKPGPQPNELGATPGGPVPQENQLPGTLPAPETEGETPEISGEKTMDSGQAEDSYGQPEQPEARPLPDPEPEDIKAYDLDIMDFGADIDAEDVDPLYEL